MENRIVRHYHHAMEVVPSLVALETPREVFLRMEQHAPAKAALRLALYWMYRHESFGEHWLLPMSQTGVGALRGQELLLLRSGFLLFIPREPNPLVLIDCGKLGNNPISEETALRMVMYFTTAISSNPLTQTNGVIIVDCVSGERRQIHLWPVLFEKLRSAFPCKVVKITVAQAFDPTKSIHLLDYVRYRVVKISSFNSKTNAENIYGRSVAETIHNLEKNGFARCHLPLEFGGSLNVHEEVAKWTRMRLSMEDIMGSCSPTTQMGVVPRELAVYVKSASEKSNRKRANCSKETSLASKRQRDAMYSRRHYHRQKIQLTSLQGQVRLLKERNGEARREYQRLQGLVALVNGVIGANWLPNLGAISTYQSQHALPPQPPLFQETVQGWSSNGFVDLGFGTQNG